MADYIAAKLRIMNHAKCVWLPDALADLCTQPRLPNHEPMSDLVLSQHLQMAHNRQNVSVVWSVLSSVLKDSAWQVAARQVLHNFAGLPHRCQWTLDAQNVAWVNDSKATNVASTLAAIQSVSNLCAGRLIWLAGGAGKGQDFAALLPMVSAHVGQVVLFGAAAAEIAAVLSPLDMSVQCVETLAEAVAFAQGMAQSGDVVLFSPSCASFDQFADYAQRGEMFVRLMQPRM